jgi:TatD DNase family protein
MVLFDSHAHLNDNRFGPDLPAVLQRAREAGLVGILNVGFDLGSSRLAVEMAQREPDLYAAVGIHPHEAQSVDAETLAQLRELAAEPKVLAIGETGLDYYRNLSPRPDQRRAFAEFIELSTELDLPLIVHCREAQEDTLAVLDEHCAPGQTVIMHCFAGGHEFAEKCLQRGYSLGLAGTITYNNAHVLREVAAEAPLESLLIETDCPWLPPQPYRGKRNEPAYVALVVEAVARAQGAPVEAVAAATARNACRLLRLPAWGLEPGGLTQ